MLSSLCRWKMKPCAPLLMALLHVVSPFALVERQSAGRPDLSMQRVAWRQHQCCLATKNDDPTMMMPQTGRRRTRTVPLFSSTKEDVGLSSGGSSSIRPDLPDYGKTSVEIDRIRLEKKAASWRRKDLFGTSIVDDTVREMENDAEFQATQRRYRELGGQEKITAEERAARRRALTALGVPSFSSVVREKTALPKLRRREPKVLQLNIGLYCNQACGHCHVESSPLRKEEMMTAETAARCLELLENTPSITTLDLTGGAPELNKSFRYLVAAARALRGFDDDLEIIDRCNLTVLQEPGQEDLVTFLKEHRVRIIASLPCYSAENVDQQRGNGVFDRSIAALLALNEAGYGSDPSLPLDLVYNPSGAFLPPEQSKLQVQYKKQLADNFGILFDTLFTITNMPIKRFADFLHRRGELKEYMDLLVRNFNADTVDKLMCLDTVNVGYDGTIYDCDFNQQLAMGIAGGGLSVFDVTDLRRDLQKRPIRTDNHCFGCTAGMGSS